MFWAKYMDACLPPLSHDWLSVCVNLHAAPGPDSSVWEEAEGAEELVCWGKPAEASTGHEAGQRVQTEHPQAEEEGDEGAARSRSAGVSNNIQDDSLPIICTELEFNTQIWTALSDSVTRSTTSVKRWPRGSKRSPVRRSSSRPRSRAWEMSVAKRQRERRYEQRIYRLTAHMCSFWTKTFPSAIFRLCMTPCWHRWTSCTEESRHMLWTWNVTSPRCQQTFKWIFLFYMFVILLCVFAHLFLLSYSFLFF